MGWASGYIAKLLNGEAVNFRPRGNSMSPKIKSGQLCTVVPIATELDKGDIVLCRVHGTEYLHLIKAVRGDQYQIANNHGHVNGWIGRSSIFGKLV